MITTAARRSCFADVPPTLRSAAAACVEQRRPLPLSEATREPVPHSNPPVEVR
ncbi:hypothetical protein [Streptomyces albipurpureus]|uniref:Uncharacterized protein n=1 Tax=Streptomyces albipurpureus TaxID=2897419 RepID=A0ABT0UG64_9ACTN|nr:hypothetical protein [Streptomyces sp. CWNU-1]MCM2387404.1 hypothetical protein [Streptomyces sp. CWNU-1]